MRRTSTTAILLTLVMLLMVLLSAVYFLLMGNQDLDQQLVAQQQERATLEAAGVATQQHLDMQLALRQSVQQSTEATRDALADRVNSQERELESQQEILSSREAELELANETLQEQLVQLYLFSPEDGLEVTPDEPIDVIIAAQGQDGIDSIIITINEEEWRRYTAGGQGEILVETTFEPPEEGEYVISALVHDRQGRTRQPASVTVHVAYASPEAREAALQQKIESAVQDIRLPKPSVPEIEPAVVVEVQESDLHLLLLTGYEVYTGTVVDNDLLTLRAFDFAPPGYDLGGFVATTARLGGYYNPDSGAVRIYELQGAEGGDLPEPSSGETDEVTRETAAEPFSLWLYVHDFAHQLQNERFNADALSRTMANADARAALRALAEGEATYLQYLTVQSPGFTPESRTAISETLELRETDVFSIMPTYIAANYAFPYWAGFRFVGDVIDGNSIKTLDSVWGNPPVSTEQILHPDRYRDRDTPVTVPLASLQFVLGEAWRLVGTDTLGEWRLGQYLQQALPAETAEAAAAGWGGDRYAVYWREVDDALVMILRLAWDTPEDRQEFANAFDAYLAARFGTEAVELRSGGRCRPDGYVICIFPRDGDSLIIRAPTLREASAIANAQPGTFIP